MATYPDISISKNRFLKYHRTNQPKDVELDDEGIGILAANIGDGSAKDNCGTLTKTSLP